MAFLSHNINDVIVKLGPSYLAQILLFCITALGKLNIMNWPALT